MRYTPGVKSEAASESYTRAEIRRILRINENRLRSWERGGLTKAKETYSFADLISLRTLQGLRESRIPVKRIREALDELRTRLANVTSPLDELKIVSDGRRIAVRLPGEKLEALTGQLLFDFDARSLCSVATFEPPVAADPVTTGSGGEDFWFQQAQRLEQAGAADEEVIHAYRQVIKCNPDAAGAWVNIGTRQFRQGQLQLAESSYMAALRIHPDYAVAHYNLGNVCDATDRLEEAAHHYEEALRLQQDYADAHYNLALVYSRLRRVFEAIRHWDHYLELDASSQWAVAARKTRERLLGMAVRGAVVGESFRKPFTNAPE